MEAILVLLIEDTLKVQKWRGLQYHDVYTRFRENALVGFHGILANRHVISFSN